jgi:hypothetical protein
MTKDKVVVLLETESSNGMGLSTVECADTAMAKQIIESFETHGVGGYILRRRAFILYDPAPPAPRTW